jgi:hypothetical protein
VRDAGSFSTPFASRASSPTAPAVGESKPSLLRFQPPTALASGCLRSHHDRGPPSLQRLRRHQVALERAHFFEVSSSRCLLLRELRNGCRARREHARHSSHQSRSAATTESIAHPPSRSSSRVTQPSGQTARESHTRTSIRNATASFADRHAPGRRRRTCACGPTPAAIRIHSNALLPRSSPSVAVGAAAPRGGGAGGGGWGGAPPWPEPEATVRR